MWSSNAGVDCAYIGKYIWEILISIFNFNNSPGKLNQISPLTRCFNVPLSVPQKHGVRYANIIFASAGKIAQCRNRRFQRQMLIGWTLFLWNMTN